MNSVRTAKIGFDGWVLDPDSGDLERAETRIRLQEQSLQVLLELIAAGGGLVTREQLIAKLWPKGVVDFDTGLNSVVRKLRVALGDTADTPRYIETLPRRGYRFVGRIDTHPAVPAAQALQAAPQPAATESKEEVVPRDHGLLRAGFAWRAPVALAAVLGALALLILGWHHSPGVDLSRPQESLVRATPAVAPLTGAALLAPSAQSIAILPFVNLSADKDQEYFADGLAEELLDLLAKTPGLHVTARTSSFSFKGKSDDIPTIAVKLKVANILEGSVRRSGDRLRVTAQLIRADTGEHAWSDTYERHLNDIFSVQDEIAGAVVAALKVHLLPSQQSLRSELRTSNLEAYDLYLQGRESYNQGDPASYQRAVTLFRHAVALDSRYAAAYASLALAEFWSADADPSTYTAGYERGLAAAQKSVALAPDEAAGYSARGFLRAVNRFDFAGARADLAKAEALNAGDANVLHRSAIVLAVLGDLPSAIDREQKALALDPLSAEICMRLAFFYVAAQRFAEARPLYEKALAIAPNSVRAQFNLGDLDLLEHRPAEALVAYRKTALESFSLSGQAKAEYTLGHDEVSRELLAELVAKHGNYAAYAIARNYAWRGDSGKALEWLERAYTLRDPGLSWIKIDYSFRSLHDDARYRALLRKMNLPE